MLVIKRTGKILTLDHRLCSVLLNVLAEGYLNHHPHLGKPHVIK